MDTADRKDADTLAVVLLLCISTGMVRGQPKPNIVLVFMDNLKGARLTVYYTEEGGKKTAHYLAQ